KRIIASTFLNLGQITNAQNERFGNTSRSGHTDFPLSQRSIRGDSEFGTERLVILDFEIRHCDAALLQLRINAKQQATGIGEIFAGETDFNGGALLQPFERER